MNTVPAIFHPAHAAPWWTPAHVTAANFGWYILAGLLIAATLSAAQEWIRDRWEITCGRPRVTRRWYGTHAHVCLRGSEDDEDAFRFSVLAWRDKSTPVPWLLVANIDDEDDGPYWAPVTDFAPYTVRRFRPHILRTEHYRFPQLFDYRPTRQPSGHPGEVRDAA